MEFEDLTVRWHSDVDLEVGEFVVVVLVLAPGEGTSPGLLGGGES